MSIGLLELRSSANSAVVANEAAICRPDNLAPATAAD
jgi:hypothetical protein